jgi:arylsulfatase
VIEQEVLKESTRFIREAVAADKPFFVWHNTTRMHYRTNLSPEYQGKTGLGVYADGLAELDDIVGALLDLLEELGVDENTIIMFSTDNGAASNSWPDGGNQPFRGEKGAGGYEGGFRVPMMVKWDGRIPAGAATGEFMIMEDWLPTIMSIMGQPTLAEELREGKEVGGETYRVHLDGIDQTDLVLNQGKSKRMEYYYFTETTFHGLRYGPWKLMYTDQERWFRSPQPVLSSPYITNLKLDPFERFHEARGYDEWAENRSWLFAPAMMQLETFVRSFEEFPPRQPSFSPKVDDLNAVLQSMRKLPSNR